MVAHDVDIERGPPPSKMEKVVTVLSKMFKVKRYIIMFFIAWVAFAFTCANSDQIKEFIPDAPVSPIISGTNGFRSDRNMKHKKLSDMGNTACGNIGENANVIGTVMFLPAITKQQGRTVRVKVTSGDGSIVTVERYRCIMVKWTDQSFTEYHKQLCDNDAFCVQHLMDVIRSRAHSEL